jgi:CPA1 family monovalent cation:H+ antiporter
MSNVEVILGLLLAVVVLATLAERLNIPYPIVLVGGGLVLGAVPQLPNVELEPDTVFLLFLPPAIFSAAITTDWPRFRSEIRPILALAVNLVLTTMLGVAVVAFAVMNHMSWDVAFVLGAIVSPPDAVATIAIVRRLHLPHQVIAILEGESLINDVTALIAYRYAVAAVVTGTFSLWEAGTDFVLSAILAVILGLAVSAVITWFVSAFVEDPTTANVLSCLAPVAAYMPAEHLHASGVLAVVIAGLVFSRASSRRSSAATRLQAAVVWRVLMFVIDGLVFVLIGLQLPTVIDGLSAYSARQLLWYGLAISLAAVIVRAGFVALILNPKSRWPSFRVQAQDMGWGTAAAVAWAGPRGILTLGTALALPYTTATGMPFPDRNLVIFLAFCVILATLVGQGLSLPFLIRRIGFPEDDSVAREMRLAARAIIVAGIHRLDELEDEPEMITGATDTLRSVLRTRLLRYPEILRPASGKEMTISALQHRISQAVTAAQRAELASLEKSGQIGEAARRAVEGELDLTEVRAENVRRH